MIKKKTLLRIIRTGDLLLSLTDEYHDAQEWENQAEYWHKRHKVFLKAQGSLIQTKHVAVMDHDLIETASKGKVYTFPLQMLKVLTFDEVDRLLDG